MGCDLFSSYGVGDINHQSVPTDSTRPRRGALGYASHREWPEIPMISQ